MDTKWVFIKEERFMQIQSVSNNQPNFNGTIYSCAIIDKSRAKALNKVYKDLDKMIKNKPYDLHIEENYGAQNVIFSLNKYIPRPKKLSLQLEMKSVVDDYSKLSSEEKLVNAYRRSVKDLIKSYDSTQNFIDNVLLPAKTVSRFCKKLGNRISKLVSGKDEV